MPPLFFASVEERKNVGKKERVKIRTDTVRRKCAIPTKFSSPFLLSKGLVTLFFLSLRREKEKGVRKINNLLCANRDSASASVRRKEEFLWVEKKAFLGRSLGLLKEVKSASLYMRIKKCLMHDA